MFVKSLSLSTSKNLVFQTNAFFLEILLTYLHFETKLRLNDKPYSALVHFVFQSLTSKVYVVILISDDDRMLELSCISTYICIYTHTYARS